MMSREAEEEKEETEENKQSGAPGCQLSASSPGSPEGGPSAACDESRASASLQKDDPQLPSAHTGLTETTERNGQGVVKKVFRGVSFISTGHVFVEPSLLLCFSTQVVLWFWISTWAARRAALMTMGD